MDTAVKGAKFVLLGALTVLCFVTARVVVDVGADVHTVATAATDLQTDVHTTAGKVNERVEQLKQPIDKATAALEQHRLMGVKLNRVADALNDPKTGVPAILANANGVVVKASAVEDETLTDQKKAGAAMDALRALLESDDLQASLASETVAMRKLAAMADKGDSILGHADHMMANGDKKVDQLVNPTRKQRMVQGLKDAGHWATVILRLFF